MNIRSIGVLLNRNLAPLFLLVMLSAMFIMGIGAYTDNRIVHEFPLTLLSSNHYFFLSAIDATLDQGHYRWLPGYLNYDFDRSLTQMPPGIIHLGALFADFTGLPTYDAMELLFLSLFMLIPVAYVMLFPDYPREVLLFSTMLLPLLFVKNFIQVIWKGYYGFTVGILLLFWFLHLVISRELRHPLVYGMILSAIFLAHAPEFFLGILILVGFWVTYLQKVKWGLAKALQEWKFWLQTATVFLICSGFYLVVFFLGAFSVMGGTTLQSYLPKIIPPTQLFPEFIVTAWSFPLLILAVILTGVIVMFLKPFPQRRVVVAVLLIANANYFAFLPALAERAFQWRFLLPITLGPLFGIGIYTLLGMVRKKFNRIPGRWGTIGLATLLGGILLLNMGYFNRADRSYLMTPDVYAAFQWIDKHTPPEAEVLLLYGDLYQEGGLAMRHRHMNAEIPSLFKLGFNNFTDGHIAVSMPEPGSPINRIFNQSRIQSIAEQREARKRALSHRNICNFDYYVLDKFSSFVEGSRLIVFNAGFMQRAAERNAITVVYQNDRVVILQNIKKGESCV